MRVSATRRGKICPTYEELSDLASQLGAQLRCPCCQKAMNWLGAEGLNTVISLRHDTKGLMRLVCRACSTRATAVPDDKYYTMSPDEKRCSACGELRPLSEFLVDRSRSRNAGAYCKSCSNRKVVKWVKERRESSLEDRVRYLFKSKRAYYAKPRDGRPFYAFKLSEEDILSLFHGQKGRCHYSGRELRFDDVDHDSLMSIDRINNADGYTKLNVVFCCWRVNNMKHELDRTAFLEWVQMIARNQPYPSFLSQGEVTLTGRRWVSMDSALRVKRNSAAQRSNRAGMAFSLSYDELLAIYDKQAGLCRYTRIPLTYNTGGDTDVSIDRIDSDQGYTASNVALCCLRVNYMKGELALTEFMRWIESIHTTALSDEEKGRVR